MKPPRQRLVDKELEIWKAAQVVTTREINLISRAEELSEALWKLRKKVKK